MVLRVKKKSRKFLGSRSWGVGNIKNARGSGDRGGTGRGGKKGKWTHTVVYDKDSIKKVGFSPWRKKNYSEINLEDISKNMDKLKKGNEIMLRNYKVLSRGEINVSVKISAKSFSKKAEEKIKAAGGEAVKL